ncbi:uncharacterized protein LOC124155403 [Ischnura elegans]|uniref:uncharacterized protein LOC124155403 n=1 Tax=Ischnura elegans TaxID=197161 RepID=UPI001ED86903|nr:uncharacterized protein LOC124155403 [Ischnura elegans]
MAGPTFAVALFLWAVSGVSASIPVHAMALEHAVPFIRSTLKWTRHTMHAFAPEIHLLTCALNHLGEGPHAEARLEGPPAVPLLLLEALSAPGATDEDSSFLLGALGSLFPGTFPAPVRRRKAREDGPSVAEAWQAAVEAVIVSVTGSPRPPQDPWHWLRVRRQFTGASAVPPESRRWTLVPLHGGAGGGAVLRVQRGTVWWRRLQYAAARWWLKVRGWAWRGGLRHCIKDYLVEVLWRWVEQGSRGLQRSLSTRARTTDRIHSRIQL